METRFHRLKDGRMLAYYEYGDLNGHPVFFAHGTPGSRLEGLIFHDQAARHGLRFIVSDRPGMGRSTFMPERTLLDYPRDLLSLANALKIERFGVMGWSGGGAHTIACGYVIPDRLTFNIALAGYTNFAELPGAAKMLKTRADRLSVHLARKGSWLFGGFYELLRLNVKYLPKVYLQALFNAVNETDRSILLNQEFQKHFIADQQEAVVQGGRGVTVDAAVHYKDWGFRLREFSGRLHVFHGSEDRNVPFAYAEHLAQNIPGCQLHVLEGQGHLFPVDHQALIFDTALSELAGQQHNL